MVRKPLIKRVEQTNSAGCATKTRLIPGLVIGVLHIPRVVAADFWRQ
jgi:hypothetical protein